MRVFLIGGFLGSGKTTTVLKLIERLIADDKKVAMIVNEVGEIGIDGAALETAGIPSKEIAGGCICCTLVINLRHTVTEIAKIYNPDILIIEPTGLSFPNQIRDELLGMNVMMSFAPVVTLIDASRFIREMDQIPNFIESQLNESEIIAINKIDLVTEEQIKSIESLLKEKYPDAYTMRMSATTDDAAVDKIYKMIIREGEEFISRIDTEGRPKSKVTEKLNSIEISNVTRYSGIYNVSGKLTVKSAGTLLENLVGAVGMEISKINPSFVGHIKMAIKVDDTFVKVSQTAGTDDRKVEAEYIKQEMTENNGKYELRFLASATNVPKDKVVEIVDQSMNIFLTAKKLTFEKETHIKKTRTPAIPYLQFKFKKLKQKIKSFFN
ncbi:MAG: GTP-binding protein [Methanosarcinales archaeon]|jgi:G3E family GTPase/SHS2 domain-containing protein|nr:GTP-binding protein [Methanosarcinales archaeon]